MRTISVLLVAVMVLFMMVPAVGASEQLDLEQAIIDAMVSGEKVDLSRFELDTDELFETYTMLYQTGRLPWYADHSCQWTETDRGEVVEFDPKGLSETGYDEDVYEQKIAELIHATCHEGMNDWQKALSVHDYMATHIAYDNTQVLNSGYDALTKGSSACEGYAQLYLDVMRRIGIPCQIAECDDTGDGIGHAWNLIRLDGDWYHVDVTWDDATPDIYGRVLHTHFLRTDDQFNTKENGHDDGWVAYEECDGEKYSKDMPWEGIESAIAFDTDGTMYIHRSVEGAPEITKVASGSRSEEVIYSGQQCVVNLGDGDCYFPAMGITLWNDRLYFTTAGSIISVNTDGSDERTEFSFDVSANQKVILGSFVDAGSVYLTLANKDMVLETLVEPIADGQFHTHSYSQTGTREASCSEAGGTVYSCECGASYIADKIPATAHELEEKEGEGSDGRTLYVCRQCGYSFDEADMQKQAASSGGIWLWSILGAVVLIIIVIASSGKKKRR